jgi:hypothetical protein
MDKHEANQIEHKIAKILHMKRVPMSGAQWPQKEDVESEEVIGQIKACETTTKSISVKRQDVVQLIKRALITHKIPLFLLFMKGLRYPLWICIPYEYLDEYIETVREEEE